MKRLRSFATAILACLIPVTVAPPAAAESNDSYGGNDPFNPTPVPCCACFEEMQISIIDAHNTLPPAKSATSDCLLIPPDHNGMIRFIVTVLPADDPPTGCESALPLVKVLDGNDTQVSGQVGWVTEHSFASTARMGERLDSKTAYRVMVFCQNQHESPTCCFQQCIREADCHTCGHGDVCEAGAGQPTAELGCARVRFPLGTAWQGDVGPLELIYHTDSAVNPGRLALSVVAPHTSVALQRDPLTTLLQAVTSSNIRLEITPAPNQADPNRFIIEHFIAGAQDSFRTSTVENVATGNNDVLLRITSSAGSKTSIIEFRQPPQEDENVSVWYLATGLAQPGGDPLRRESLTITLNEEGDRRIERHVVWDPGAPQEYQTLSDIESTYARFIWGWERIRQVAAPGAGALVSEWDYYTQGEPSGIGGGPGSGFGRLKSHTRHDGHREMHFYEPNTRMILRPFADDPDQLTELRGWHPPSRTLTVTRTVNDLTLSKQQWIGGHVGAPQTTIRTFTSSDSSLDTVVKYVVPGIEFGGEVARITRPDGTVTIHSRTRQGGASGTKTIVTLEGVPDGDDSISEGTRREETFNHSGQLVSSMTTAKGTGEGATLDLRTVGNHDPFGRPGTTTHFEGAYTTSTSYGCCGIETETDRYGITTSYHYDALLRRIKTNRLGVTTETRHSGRITTTHRYDEPALSGTLNGNDQNQVARHSRNLAGTEITSGSPNPFALDAQGNGIPGALTTTTTIISYSSAGRASQTTVPDLGSQTTYTHPDGRLWKTTGNLEPQRTHAYAVNPTGLVTATAYLIEDGDPPIVAETTTTQFDWAGRTLQTARGTIVHTYDYFDINPPAGSRGKLRSVIDSDAITTLYAYNVLGERTTTALDLNETNTISYGFDQITRTESFPTERQVGTDPEDDDAPVIGTVIRTETRVWRDNDTDDEAGGTVIACTDQTPDGLKFWSWQIGEGTTFNETVINPQTAAAWAVTTTRPDGSYNVTTHVGGLMDVSANYNSDNGFISSTSVRDASNDPISGYDILKRPTHQRDSRTGLTTTAYLSTTADYVVSVSDAADPPRITSYAYDIRGRRTRVDAPKTFDPAGDPGNLDHDNLTITAYNPDGTILSVTGDQTYPVSYTYDYAARLKTMQTFGTVPNVITAWNYDPDTGLLVSKRYHSDQTGATGSGPDFDYTPAGRLETRQWARKVDPDDPESPRITTTYEYTSGLLTSVTYNDGTPAIVYNYDAFPEDDNHLPGTLETVTQGGRTWVYRYAPATLRLLSETHPVGGTAIDRLLTRTHDASGRPQAVFLGTAVNPDLDHSLDYDFDTAGRLDQVRAAGKTFRYTFTPDSPDLIATIEGPADLLVTNSWDPTRDALLANENKVDTAVISGYTYNVNALGQRQSVTTTGSAFGNTNRGWGWGYDNLGQLTVATHAADPTHHRAYDFDAIGNRLESTVGDEEPATTVYTPNPLNQYSSIKVGEDAPVAPVHDLDGNLRDDAGVNAFTYALKFEWDAENRITAVRKAPDTLLATYTYDHLGRRIRKSTTAAAPQGAGDTGFLYDGWNVIAEYTIDESQQQTTATLLQAYTWGADLSGSLQGAGGVGGLLCIHRTPGIDPLTGERIWEAAFYPTYDGNGNISEYLDQDGEEIAHFEYDPFGRTIAPTGAHAAFTYRFSTKPLDIETGYYYYGYRYMDPVTGRWPSRDPIEEQGGLNLYGFANNDGVGRYDLLGMWFADGLGRQHLDYHGVVLDGAGGAKVDMRGGHNARQLLHEQTHVVQFQGGGDPRNDVADDEKIAVGPVKRWHAIPYKQLFRCCIGSDGEVSLDGTGKAEWCYPINRGSEEAGQFDYKVQQRSEKDLWDPGTAIWKHTNAEMAAFEIPVSTWQWRRETTMILKAKLGANLRWYESVEEDETLNPVWDKYKEWIDEAKRLYAIHGLEWKWKLPDHVYMEFLD